MSEDRDDGQEELDEDLNDGAGLDDGDTPLDPELDDEDDDLDPDPNQEDLDEDDDPATPGTPSPEAPLPAHVARNENGRLYDKRTGNFLPESQQAPAPPETQGQPGAAPADEPYPETPEGAEPLVFHANKQPFHIRGSYQTADGGYYIPKQAVSDLTRTLAAGQHHLTAGQEQFRSWQREKQQLQRQIEHERIESQHISQTIGEMVEKGPQAFIEWASALHDNWPKLQLEAQNKRLEAQLRARTEPEQHQQQERQQAELLETAETELERAILEEAAKHPGFTQEELVPIYRQLRATLDSVVFQADRDYPEQRIRKGQLVLDRAPVELALANAAHWKQQARAVATATRAAATANARRGGVVTPPPAPRGARAPSGDAGKAPVRRRVPRTREEADGNLSRPVDEVNAEIGYNPTGRR